MEGSVPERGQRDLSQRDQRVRGFRKGEPVRGRGVHAAFGQVLNFFKNTRAFGAGSGRAWDAAEQYGRGPAAALSI